MNNPEIRHEQVLNNPELQPPVGIDAVTPEQQATITPEHSLMDRIRESRLLVGATTLLAAGALAVGSAEKVDAGKKKYTNRYFAPSELRDFTVTQSSFGIRACQDINVNLKRATPNTKVAYPYGNIESQRIVARVGKKNISVVTKLRDTNYEVNAEQYVRPSVLDEKVRFVYGCNYVTNSNTTLSLRTRKSKTSISPKKIISYQENPRIFHQKRFVAKTFKTKLNLPKKLTKRDLKKGTYCVSSRQFSEPIARPFDINAVEISSPGRGYKLLDPSQNVGMINQDLQDGTNDGVMPSAKSKTYKKCITKTKQYTLKPPKDSPWTHYPY